MGKRQWPRVWQHIEGLGEVLTRGTCGGLPVLAWGWAPRELFATYRQLRAMGLRPGGSDPVVCLHFGHHKPGLKSLDHAHLYLVSRCVSKRVATPAQLAAIAKALKARRTCTRCGREQTYYPSTISRQCSDCDTETRFWEHYAADRGYATEVAA
jgi:hypothetical protein